MNDKFKRMKALLEELGITFAESGISNGEIYAYSVGLNLVQDYIYDILKQIFINLDDSNVVSLYAKLLNLSVDQYSLDEIKQMIFARLGQAYGEYTQSVFDKAFSTVGSGSYEITSDAIIFKDVELDDLKRLGEFIKGYVYMNTKTSYDGSGLTFDQWDNWGQRFIAYDNFGLCFDIIDNLRGDIIE